MSRVERFVEIESTPILERLRTAVSDAWKSFRSSWTGPLTVKSPEIARVFSAYTPASSGVQVDEKKAMAVSAFFGGTTLIAGDTACR